MRRRRQLLEGAEYHVTARINRGEKIFLAQESRELFMGILKRAKNKFNFSLKNFCVMGNHIHFLIKPGPGESLSKIMQWILGVFAQLWNKKHQLSGHLWGDRFFSRIILGILDFLRVFLYIDYNPVMAGMAKQPGQWMYGGLCHHKKGVTDITDIPDPAVLDYFPEHKALPDNHKIAEV
jgi:REP element-mobilizing transposase RayT